MTTVVTTADRVRRGDIIEGFGRVAVTYQNHVSLGAIVVSGTNTYIAFEHGDVYSDTYLFPSHHQFTVIFPVKQKH